jgi:hypothetical protein
MTDLMILGGGLAAGYVLSVFTWPQLRTFLTGTEQEIAQVRASTVALEAGLRSAFGSQQNPEA